jgi:hypothetical protein
MPFEKLPRIQVGTLTFRAKVPQKEIGFINSIIEGYEGIGIVRTSDERLGIIEFWILPEHVAIFERVIEDLRIEVPITFVSQEQG